MSPLATSTISNTITGPTGTAIANVRVIAKLMPSAGFRIDAFSEVARTVEATSDANGLWSLALERNSNISPANTYYQVTELIPDASGGRRIWNISVGASNQTVLAALVDPLPDATTGTYLTQAAADARYQALSALGSGTPGTETPDHAGTAGVATSASRSDHIHPIAAATPITVILDGGGALSEGVSTSFARADHQHAAANDVWTTYTPTLTQSGAVTKTVTYARYLRVGRMITVEVLLVATGAGTGANRITVSLPVTAAQGGDMVAGSGYVFDASAATVYAGPATLFSTTSAAIYLGSGVANHLGAAGMTAALANTDNVSVSLTYEAAT